VKSFLRKIRERIDENLELLEKELDEALIRTRKKRKHASES